MSKIICDVCGSAYSDTATQCPICGTAKRDDYSVSAESEQKSDTGYHYVKGGRFSHSNVRKHNSGKQLSRSTQEKEDTQTPAMPPLVTKKAAEPKPVVKAEPKAEKKPEPKPVKKAELKPAPQKEQNPDELSRSTNIILIIIVFVLLAAVIFAGVYVVQNYKDLFAGNKTPTEPNSSTHQTVGGVYVPCSSITLPALEVVESDGSPVKLDVVFMPTHTTDDKIFVSSDPTVATVSDKGVLTVLSSGQVTITITCGEQTAELNLTCVFVDPNAPTDPTDPPAPTEPEGELRLVDAKGKIATDVTFTKYGDTYQLYAGDIDASLVTFTSSDPSVVTVDENGKIKIVGKGIAVITAQCGSKKAECKIICSKVEVPVETSYKISFSDADPLKGDVTMVVGEKQTIQLLDIETGAPVSGLTWYQSMPEDNYIALEERSTGVRVTALEVTVGVKGVAYVRVMCDYEGVTYTCIVRVKAPPETEPAGE